jgi:hypothetical protein
MSDNCMSDAEEDDDILEAIQVWREAKSSKKSTQQLLLLLYAKDDVYTSLPEMYCVIFCAGQSKQVSVQAKDTSDQLELCMTALESKLQVRCLVEDLSNTSLIFGYELPFSWIDVHK